MITASVFGGLALLTLLIMGIYKGCMILWPGRGDWYAASSYLYELPPNDPQRAIDKIRIEESNGTVLTHRNKRRGLKLIWENRE